MENIYKVNLQLFADDEELEDEIPLEPVDGEVEDELEEEEVIEEEQPDEEELDSKTRAIIKHKKEAAAYKRKAEELEAKLEQQELAKEQQARVIELTKQGKDATEATRIATDEADVKLLKIQLAKMELEKLETKYPGIKSYAKNLLEDKGKLPEFTFEQLYLAKYSKNSQYDNKTKLEQELLYRNREARSKSLEPSNTKTPTQVKLTPDEERTFRYLKGTMPDLTRKRFKELQGSDSLE